MIRYKCVIELNQVDYINESPIYRAHLGVREFDLHFQVWQSAYQLQLLKFGQLSWFPVGWQK